MRRATKARPCYRRWGGSFFIGYPGHVISFVLLSESMTIQDVLVQLDGLPDDAVIYATRVDGQFQATSSAVALLLTEDELDMYTNEIARLKCPGFDYFLEVFIIKELVEALIQDNPSVSTARKAEVVIHYAEFDA